MNSLTITLLLGCVGAALATYGCYEPDPFDHGDYKRDDYYGQQYPVGHKLYYKCHDGYCPYGPGYTECYRGGWKNKYGCEPCGCKPPPQPQYGYYSPVAKYYKRGSRIVYKCKHGYELKGSSYTRTCGHGGQWYPTAPVCVPIVRYCPKPPALLYGKIIIGGKPKYTFPDSIVYKCNIGYYIKYGPKYTCQKDGTWNPKPFPVCLPLCKKPSPIPVGGDYSPKENYYDPGDKVTFTCGPRYYLSGADVLTCLVSGKWNKDTPQCIPKPTCPYPGRPDNGDFSPVMRDYFPGAMVHYTCDKTYVLVGEKKLTCQKNGKWNFPVPKCRPTCSPRASPANGGYNPKKAYYLIGQTITFYCKTGYHLVGKKVHECEDDGHWDVEDIPKCVRICKVPYIENGGVVKPKDFYYEGNYAVYYCKTGYSLSDNKGVCRPDGTWHPLGKCTLIGTCRDRCYGDDDYSSYPCSCSPSCRWRRKGCCKDFSLHCKTYYENNGYYR